VRSVASEPMESAQPGLAHLIGHNATPGWLERNGEPLGGDAAATLGLVPSPGVRVPPEAVLFRVHAGARVTRDGVTLEAGWEERVGRWVRAGFEPRGGSAASDEVNEP